MADDTATTEVVETPAESEAVDTSEQQAQPDTDTDNVSEDDQNSSDDTASPQNRGDLNEALRQERETRRRYEAALNDPRVIYEQAKKLGLTEEEAQEQATTQVQAQNPTLTPVQVTNLVDARLDYEKAVTEYPEVAKDRELNAWATALVDSGMSHVQAVRAIKKRLGVTAQTAKTEGINQAKNEITDKERAQTAPVNVSTSTEATQLEDLRQRMRSRDRKVQEKAMIEHMTLREKARRKA